MIRLPSELPFVDLSEEVQQLLLQIPSGRVTTYGELARALGDDRTRSARWLGEYLLHHPHSADCLCHRVVRSTGEVGLHISGNPRTKARLLKQEGVSVSKTGTVDLSDVFKNLVSTRPLERLREFQKSLRDDFRETPLTKAPQTFAAVDVAYRDDGTACGAYVLMNAETLVLEEQLTLTMPVNFPYIPGYLTFRELPVMLELCRRAQRQGILGDVIFCDGNGQLHPWRAGIATCLGVMLDHPLIGVGKSLLCGVLGAADADLAALPVYDESEVIARAIRVSTKFKPVYISVGHRITLDEATALARKAFARHRVPEPIFVVDRLTKRMKTQP